MAYVSIKMTGTYQYLDGYPRLLDGFVGGRGCRSLTVTQDGMTSSAAAQGSISLQLPDSPVQEEPGKTDLLG